MTSDHGRSQRRCDKTAYRELGPDHFTRRDPERGMRRMIKEANNLGLTVRFQPIHNT